MKILFTCGGSAGHINPALALARVFRARKPGCQILFVGAHGGIEERLVPKAGFPLELVTIGSFWRKANWSGVVHNAKTLRKLQISRREARQILDRFQPDLVVGTGGYASYPLVREAARRGIPTAVHESNVVPGLTTRRLAPHVDCVMTGLPEASVHYSQAKRVVVTGTPIRGEFFDVGRAQAREKLAIPQGVPVVLSMWGSLGANLMNHYMVDFANEMKSGETEFYHIHAAGGSYEDMLEEIKQRGIEVPRQMRLEEYIYDMPTVMAAADLVLCRGGASTISEISAVGKAAIIVPSPNVTNNHQEKNAAVLKEKGAAEMILERDCNGKVLYDAVIELVRDSQKRERMAHAIGEAGVPDAGEKIYQTLIKLLRKS